jgi:ATP-dependent DNA helicase PIF1
VISNRHHNDHQYLVQAHPGKISTFDHIAATVILAALHGLCCMLLNRIASQATKQPGFAIVALPQRPRPRSFQPPKNISHSLLELRRYSRTMLRLAVQEHDHVRLSPTDAPLTNTSGTLRQPAMNTTSRNPLVPASASTLNTVESRQTRPRNGIKRTSSGIAKVVGGIFEEEMDAGSRNRPIVLGDDTTSTARPSQRGTTHDYTQELCDIDFDSDGELELEMAEVRPYRPAACSKPNVHQPFKKPALHSGLAPTSPLRQQTQLPTSNNSTGSFRDSPSNKLPESSAPLQWSSSPADHHTAKAPSLQAYAHKPGTAAMPASKSIAHAMIPKGRKLPWLSEEERDQTDQAVAASAASNVRASTKYGTATPQEKNTSAHKLWNTSLSAVKEQQKKHREDSRKAPKKVDSIAEPGKAAKTTQKRPAKVFLSDEQKHVLELVSEKKSVFFTGSAGTGKSVLLREIITTLRKKFAREPDRVAVTASTGLAACNVGGITLHSFSGIGLGKEDVPELVRKIKKNQKAKNRWMRTKTLVIDEVSMVDGELFDKLEAIARNIRNNARPFGGIQLVITGDFFQLPPVPDNNRIAKFAFDAATWPTSIEYTIGLHHVFRQKDPKFAGMLNEMREGRLSENSITEFRKLSRPLPMEDQLVATELFPTRVEVDKANRERLGLLQGANFTFDAVDGGTIQEKAFRDKLLSNCLAPETIVLKKGAQVMLIKNIDESLVNGSVGRIIAFMDERAFDSHVATNGAEEPASPATQSAGDGSSIKDIMMGRAGTSKLWPLVRFSIADGTHRDLLCQAESWKFELPTGEVQASRSQVPLILAWALSIHKAQGQTLDRVKVDLGKVFEKGQAYVALSRATSMEGLQVLRFDPKKVNAHERVRVFYSNLSRAEDATNKKVKLSDLPKKLGRDAADYEAQFLDDGFADWATNDA